MDNPSNTLKSRSPGSMGLTGTFPDKLTLGQNEDGNHSLSVDSKRHSGESFGSEMLSYLLPCILQSDGRPSAVWGAGAGCRKVSFAGKNWKSMFFKESKCIF